MSCSSKLSLSQQQKCEFANTKEDDETGSISSGEEEEQYINDDFEDDDEETNELQSDFVPSVSELGRIVKTTVPNKTFTSNQIREIERDNAILMDKILYYNRKPASPKFAKHLPRNYHKITSAEINRKKEQMKINWENQILLRKIQSVKPSIKFNRK